MSRVSSAISSVVSEVKKTIKNTHPVRSHPIADLSSPALTSWQIEVYIIYSLAKMTIFFIK